MDGERDEDQFSEDVDEGTEDDSEEESPGTDEETTWIQWFCGLKGNELFCEVRAHGSLHDQWHLVCPG
jgi:hypothetical protein